jgi:hypothetical protein
MRCRRVTLAFAVSLSCAAALAPTGAAQARQGHHKLHKKGTRPPPGGQPPHLTYYGGPVIPNVKVVAVFWGDKVDAATKKDIPTFYGDLVQSPLFDWLAEYSTPTQKIGRGSFVGAVTIKPDPKLLSGTITDAQIQKELSAQLSKKALTDGDQADTIFMIHFPPKLVITSGAGTSCAQFCAYHGNLKGKSIYYGVMPDEGAGSGCEHSCGQGSTSFDNLTSTATHELVEAVTDARVGDVGNKLSAPLAWYDPHKDVNGSEYAEIGDICGAYDGTLKGAHRSWHVQTEWSNKKGGCIVDASSTPIAIAGSKPEGAGAAAAHGSAAGSKAGKPAKKKGH